jgi:hypothetical protein
MGTKIATIRASRMLDELTAGNQLGREAGVEQINVIATLNGIDDLHAALRNRAEVVNLSREELDVLARFPAGYTSKLLAPTPMRRIALPSMFDLSEALGLQIALIENPEMMARIRDRTLPRDANRAKHSVVVHRMLSRRFMRRIGRKGGAGSRAYMTRRQASELGRRAARARWGTK